jgi:hypothetical protein
MKGIDIMSFRGMTFCRADCANKECHRQFDAEQKEAANKWWGGDGAPVAFGDMSSQCETYKPKNDSSR